MKRRGTVAASETAPAAKGEDDPQGAKVAATRKPGVPAGNTSPQLQGYLADKKLPPARTLQ